MNVAIVGTGYVGLVTGVCLAERGNTVHCVDTNPRVVEKLTAGEVTIFEPGLEDIYLRNLKRGRIAFSGGLEKAILPAEIVFLCLPTPPGGDGSADLKYILQVANDLGKIFAKRPDAGYKVVVDKSTVPVGTSDKVQAAIRKQAGPGVGLRRGVEPGVPARRVRDGGFPAAGARGDGVEQRAGDRGPQGPVRAVPAAGQQGHRDGREERRGDQVRRERVPRAEDLVHERPGQLLRRGGSGHRPDPGRDRLRLAHRAEVPLPGAGGRRGRCRGPTRG